MKVHNVFNQSINQLSHFYSARRVELRGTDIRINGNIVFEIVKQLACIG